MKKNYFIIILLTLFIPFCLSGNPKKKSIIAPGAKVEKLAGGFSFTEGPSCDKQGNIYFTDQPNNKIYKWGTDNKLTTFCDDCGRANGLYFNTEGKLLSCSDMDNEIWSIEMNGTHAVLVTEYDNKKLNGPNDLWSTPGGGIYFTDPLYKRPYWKRNPEMQQDGEHVYFLAPGSKKPVRVISDLQKPNGITGTPDGKKLFVADIKANKTYTYSINTDGTLSGKKLFAPLGSDGMTIDSKGNVYLSGKGVIVFNPKGEKILEIPVDAKWTANVCFGGKDRKTLFITASEGFYSIRMNVSGFKRNSK
jgi:gluconolactonase